MRFYPFTFLLGLLIIGLFRFLRGRKMHVLASRVKKRTQKRAIPVEDIENEYDGVIVAPSG